MPTPLALVLLFLIPPADAGPPPATEVQPVEETLHGRTIVDPYRWLEQLEVESEAVSTWTTAQNEHTRDVLDDLPEREELERRLSELMTIGSVGAPSMREDLYFYEERKGEQNQPVLHVRQGHDGEPRVLLDPNALDAEGLYALDWFEPSEDGERLAFGLSYAGDEMTVLHLMDVATGEWLADKIPGKVDFGGWLPDGSGFLYSRLDDPADAYSRSIRVHEVGRHHRHDPELFEQTEPQRIPYAFLSRDGAWMVLGVTDGWSRNDLFVADFDAWRNTGELRLTPIAEGLDARFEPQIIRGDDLYLTTTLDAPTGRVIRVDLKNPARDRWETLVPARETAVLQSLHESEDLLLAVYEENAATRIRAFDFDGTPAGELELPGIGSAGIRTHHDRSEAFVSYTSFNEPPSIYRVDLDDLGEADSKRELWARPDVPVDPSTVDVKQVWYTSKDGTRVPMFIVHKKGLELDGNNPTLLYGYGGFNVSLTPSFSATRFPWFEHGGVYALANLRGGSEFGETWHRAGMLENKQNVFDDLYAAAEHLIDEGYTSPDHLAVMGGSNGGLLAGVAVTQRPDLWTAVVSQVPLLDMLRYHNFLMAKFWVPEYGSAEDPEQFQWLMAYSPYHHVEEGVEYPAVLFTAGENDNRVHPLHARKMAALVQAKTASDPATEPVLLWVDRAAGHGQGKPLELRIREAADIWGFLMWQTGMLERLVPEESPRARSPAGARAEAP